MRQPRTLQVSRVFASVLLHFFRVPFGLLCWEVVHQPFVDIEIGHAQMRGAKQSGRTAFAFQAWRFVYPVAPTAMPRYNAKWRAVFPFHQVPTCPVATTAPSGRHGGQLLVFLYMLRIEQPDVMIGQAAARIDKDENLTNERLQ
jgi:hypothetical protein